ncbi:MAG: hypothetical protein GY795_27315 [Desulfobacterales bacterium]|nr:hypothetical protein [Desulfobacterales bacterium]
MAFHAAGRQGDTAWGFNPRSFKVEKDLRPEGALGSLSVRLSSTPQGAKIDNNLTWG